MQLGYLSHPPAGAHALSRPSTVWASFCACWAIYLGLLLSGADLPKRKLTEAEGADRVAQQGCIVSTCHLALLWGPAVLPGAARQAQGPARVRLRCVARCVCTHLPG